MKLKTAMWILLISFFTFCWVSCDKDSNEPLSLDQVENNSIKLYYGSKGGVTIIGGDGNYSFSCDSSLLKAKMTSRNYISFEALGVGNAAVTIKDQSGNSYTLNVLISYKTENIVVTKLDATVVGNDMTTDEKKELKEKALTTIPVKIGGGYKFVYTENENQDNTNGIVFIYPEKYGNDSIKGTFERSIMKEAYGSSSYSTYTLHYKNTDRTFLLMQYSGQVTKSIGYQTIQFAEDLKGQYETEYPNVEQVYTSQIIRSY